MCYELLHFAWGTLYPALTSHKTRDMGKEKKQNKIPIFCTYILRRESSFLFFHKCWMPWLLSRVHSPKRYTREKKTQAQTTVPSPSKGTYAALFDPANHTICMRNIYEREKRAQFLHLIPLSLIPYTHAHIFPLQTPLAVIALSFQRRTSTGARTGTGTCTRIWTLLFRTHLPFFSY